MKYIRKFEGQLSSTQEQIDNYLKTSYFDDMPFEYKRTVVIRAYEVNEDVSWSLDKTPDWSSDRESVEVLIKDYSDFYKGRRFKFGVVPKNLLCTRIMESDEFDEQNFDQYHKWYGDVEDHGDSIFPILADPNEDSYIEDGWHRFHNYINKNLSEIPVVQFV